MNSVERVTFLRNPLGREILKKCDDSVEKVLSTEHWTTSKEVGVIYLKL